MVSRIYSLQFQPLLIAERNEPRRHLEPGNFSSSRPRSFTCNHNVSPSEASSASSLRLYQLPQQSSSSFHHRPNPPQHRTAKTSTNWLCPPHKSNNHISHWQRRVQVPPRTHDQQCGSYTRDGMVLSILERTGKSSDGLDDISHQRCK